MFRRSSLQTQLNSHNSGSSGRSLTLWPKTTRKNTKSLYQVQWSKAVMRWKSNSAQERIRSRKMKKSRVPFQCVSRRELMQRKQKDSLIFAITTIFCLRLHSNTHYQNRKIQLTGLSYPSQTRPKPPWRKVAKPYSTMTFIARQSSLSGYTMEIWNIEWAWWDLC